MQISPTDAQANIPQSWAAQPKICLTLYPFGKLMATEFKIKGEILVFLIGAMSENQK